MLFWNRWKSVLPRPRLLTGSQTSIEPSTQCARQILNQIEQEYDFSTFTMESFCQWIERQHQRQIFVFEFAMPAEMFGCWVRLAGKDYIFYEEHTAHLHQAHIQLHELAHILCGHKTLEMAEQPALTLDALIQGLLYATFPVVTSLLTPILARSRHSSQDEAEAEALSELIQQRVHESQRSRELTQPITFSRRSFMQDAYQIMEWI